MRDQPLDWQTAPPVHVLKYLVLGGKKDASSREVGSLYSTCACVEVPGARRQEGCLEQGGR